MIPAEIHRFKKHIFLYMFVASFMPVYSLYAVMLSERGNLSASEIALIFSWWSLVGIISEVPTGVWADKVSPKSSIIIACLLQALCFAIWLMFPDFWGYIIGFTFWGLGGAFGSGSIQAYIYNKLHEQQAKKEFIKIYGRAGAFSSAGLMLAYFSTSIFNMSYTSAISISILISLLAIFAAISLPNVNEAKTRKDKLTLSILPSSINDIRESKKILFTIIFLTLISSISILLIEFAPLFYKSVGVPTRQIPILLGIGYGLTSVIAWIAHRYEKAGYNFSFYITIVGSIMMVIGTYLGLIGSIVSVILFIRLIRLVNLLLENELHHSIDNNKRATIHSVSCFLAGLLSSAFMAVYGIVAQNQSHIAAFRAFAIFTGVIAMIGLYKTKASKYEST